TDHHAVHGPLALPLLLLRESPLRLVRPSRLDGGGLLLQLEKPLVLFRSGYDDDFETTNVHRLGSQRGLVLSAWAAFTGLLRPRTGIDQLALGRDRVFAALFWNDRLRRQGRGQVAFDPAQERVLELDRIDRFGHVSIGAQSAIVQKLTQHAKGQAPFLLA